MRMLRWLKLLRQATPNTVLEKAPVGKTATDENQCQQFGDQQLETWNDYARYCFTTYRGGDGECEIENEHQLFGFQQGIQAAFNLLQNEFPQPAVLNAALATSNAIHERLPYPVFHWFPGSGMAWQIARSGTPALCGAMFGKSDLPAEHVNHMTCPKCKDILDQSGEF